MDVVAEPRSCWTKFKLALHKACAWYHSQPFGIRFLVALGLATALLLLVTCLWKCTRCCCGYGGQPSTPQTKTAVDLSGKKALYAVSCCPV